jgi:predicted amidohydrolase YtcJ
MLLKRLVWLVLIVIGITSCKFRKKVNTIIYNAKVYTVNEKFTEAAAIALDNGKIVFVGTSEDVLKQYQADSVTDAKGAIVMPGFIDAHAHFVGYGFGLQQVNLWGTNSWQECIDRVKKFIADKNVVKGAWVIGRGWDQNDWAEKKYPTNQQLNQLFADYNVVLERVDGHAVIANNNALSAANITLTTKISGGDVDIQNGQLSGVLVDNAATLVQNIIPTPTKQQYTSAMQEAQKNCFAAGITTVVDCGLMKKDVEQLDALQKNNSLKIKLNIMLSDDSINYAHYLKAGKYKTDRLHVCGFKLYADGALGSRGACLLKHYTDKPGWQGFLLKDRAYYEKILPQIYAAGFQANTHAIGDSANRMVLQVYANILKGSNDRRWRIEHAQVLNPQDFNLFGQNSIVPSVQPTHATSDMYWAKDRLGAEREVGAYAYQQLLQQNGWLPLGTDFPVEDISPLKTFLAAAIRTDAKGYPTGGYQINNALTRQQTLRGMTIWAAKGSFEESEKGSIEVGKAADIIIIDTDLMQCAPNKILGAKVLATYVNGERVY